MVRRAKWPTCRWMHSPRNMPPCSTSALRHAGSLFVIGESLGGLVALALAHLRPDRIRNVVLLDTPFHLTRPDLAAWISESWR